MFKYSIALDTDNIITIVGKDFKAVDKEFKKNGFVKTEMENELQPFVELDGLTMFRGYVYAEDKNGEVFRFPYTSYMIPEGLENMARQVN